MIFTHIHVLNPEGEVSGSPIDLLLGRWLGGQV